MCIITYRFLNIIYYYLIIIMKDILYIFKLYLIYFDIKNKKHIFVNKITYT